MNASHYGHGAAIRAWLFAVLAILLNACSGGISGTGDGGPIIIVNNIETTLDTGIGDIADGPDGSADGNADGGTDGAVDGATHGTTDGATSAPTDSRSSRRSIWSSRSSTAKMCTTSTNA